LTYVLSFDNVECNQDNFLTLLTQSFLMLRFIFFQVYRWWCISDIVTCSNHGSW